MNIPCQCPTCGSRFKVSRKYATLKIKCPKCSGVIDVPKEEGSDVVPEAQAAGGPASQSARPATPAQPPETSLPPEVLAGRIPKPGHRAAPSEAVVVAKPPQAAPKSQPVPTSPALDATVSLTAGSEDPSAAFDNPVKPPESLFGLMSPLVQMPPEDPDSSTPQAPEPELPIAPQDEACATDEACPSCGVAVSADESICPECGCDIMMAKLLGPSTVEEPVPSSTRQPEPEPEAELAIEPEPEAESEPEPEPEPEPAAEPAAEASSEDFAASFASAEDPELGSEFDFSSTLGVTEQGDAPAAKPVRRPPAKLPPQQTDSESAKTSAAASPAGAVRPPSKKRGAGIRVMILSGLGVGVLVGLGFAVRAALSSLSLFSNKPSAMATLVLDWPAKERNMGRVFIDLGRVELPNIGPIEYSIKAGDHRIILNREGYEPIRFDVTLGDGERSSYKPEWKLVMFASEASPAPAAKPAGEIKPAPPAAAIANPAPSKPGQEPPAPAAKPAGEIKPAPAAAASANPAPGKPGQESPAPGANEAKKK